MIKKEFKKIISAITAAAMLITMSIGNASTASAEYNIGTLGTYQGEWEYISTCYKSDYFDKGSIFEVTFRYDEVDPKTTAKNGTEIDVDFNGTLEYQVFDNSWNGWQRTYVGPNGYDKTQAMDVPEVGDTYTVQVPISDIEAKYTGTGEVRGINLQTGEIGDSKITILSQKVVGDVMVEGEEFTITGYWKMHTGGSMKLSSGSEGKAAVDTNEWYVDVTQFSTSGFTNPTVDVTVSYPNLDFSEAQAEIFANGKLVSGNRVQPRKKGTMTYTTELPAGTTSFQACYNYCIVTKIHVYDNTEPEPEEVTGKRAEEINKMLNPSWNLGDALDSVANGKVNETAWGNPVVTQKTFQAVRDAGFRSVRIPVSFMDKVDSRGNVEEEYLARMKKVVSEAKNCGLYVVLSMQHDSSENVSGKWLDISKTGSAFTAIKKKFTGIWQQVAYAFKDFDQHLVFQAMDQVMIPKCYDTAPSPAYSNINALNQAFVNAVRSAGSYSQERCLIIPGYNTDINLTAANYGTSNGFQVPVDSKANKLILAVNFFDPYNFTLNTGQNSVTTCTAAELREIGTQFAKIKSAASLPVFVGEYGAKDKKNVLDRADYLDRVRKEAEKRDITLAYWDDGDYSKFGFAIFDRQSNEMTEDGEVLLSAIMGNYN